MIIKINKKMDINIHIIVNLNKNINIIVKIVNL